MKRIIMFVLLFAALKVAGQTTGYFRFDTVRIMKQNGTCELYLINKTKDSLGLLTNVGGGLTQFRKSKMLNDSTIIIGLDTLLVRGTGGSGGGSVTAGYGIGVTGSQVRIDTPVVDNRYVKRFYVTDPGLPDPATTDSSGHDDCPAIIATMQRAYDAGGGIVYFPLGHYTVGCALQHSVDGVDPNAQIVLPLTNSSDLHKPRITFEGEALNNWSAELVTATAKNKAGVIIESTILDTGFVFGSTFYADVSFGGDINWTWWAFKNIDVRVRSKTSGSEINHTMSGINSFAPRSVNFDHVKVTVQSSEGSMIEPDVRTIGVILPHWNNNANILINNLNVSGYYNGVYAAEHMNATELITFSCHNGIYLPYMIHSGYIAQYTSEGCVNHIYVSNETGPFAGGPMDLHIGSYNVEHFTTPGQWNTYAADVTFADTSSSCNILLDYVHVAESGVGESYVFNTNNPRRVTVGHTNTQSGYVRNQTYVPITFAATPTGTDRGFQLLVTANGTDNLAEPQFYPASGTNVGIISSIIPRGTGFSSTLKSALNIFNTNYIADPSNFELFQMKAAGNNFLIGALKSGTGSLRPIKFQMDGVDAFYVNTDRNIHLNTDVRFGPGTSSVTDDVIKFQNNNTGATMQVQNNNAGGFSGIEYNNNSGTTTVFTGFNNSNNQEFRFNNFVSGGYIRFLTGGTEKFKVNNSGGVTFNNAFTFPAADGTSGQVLQTNGSGAVTWQTPSSGITSINSQTGPAITLTGGIGTYTSAPSANTIAYNVDPTSDIFSRTIDAIMTTAGNTGTSETDLYSKTVAGGTLNADKQTLNFEADGEFNDNTATAQLKLYFGGNVTLNTGAINISTANTAWRLRGYIIRTSSTTAHLTYELQCPGLATPLFIGYSNLTSLDFTTTNIIKITAQAGGAGGGNSDITAHSWQIIYNPQP